MRKQIVLAVLGLFVIGALLGAHHFRKMAFIGAGYAAQQTCACMFISGRTLDSCRGDLEKLAQRITRLTPGDNAVHASTILSSATSRYEPGFGCMLAD